MKTDAHRLPPITLLSIIVEFAIIIIASLNATSQFSGTDPNMKLAGNEGEWLTSSATFSSYSLQEYGYIPLWQPYLSHGEPLLDNPFSFVLNPISTLPSLIYGSNIGIRYSVILTAILAGLGGWALGRMLGFGRLGRVMLGLLLAGKGNMVGMIGAGYFQLGVSQAYIPWVLAGAVGVLRLKRQRLSVALTAIMFTLMFWAGNIYYLLPTLMSLAGLALTHILSISLTAGQFNISFDQPVIKRLATAGMLTLGLSAITFIPIFLHQDYIGRHPDEVGAGTYADIPTVVGMFFSDSMAPYDFHLVPSDQEFYQSYILPLWFAVVAFLVFPILTWIVIRPQKSDSWKVWSVGVFMILFCLLWGTGQNPVVGWLYQNVPLIGQWRFVGRMLGIVSFWLAVLAVMQVDSFWKALMSVTFRIRWNWVGHQPVFQIAFKGITALICLVAASSVLGQWKQFAGPSEYGVWPEDTCVIWLRQQHPDRYLSVWTLDYTEITVYLLNRVRHANITADFRSLGSPSTLFRGDLTRLLPQYGIAGADNVRAFFTEQGYHQVLDSPMVDDANHCAWEKSDVHAYAFTVPLPVVNILTDTLPVGLTTPVTNLVQYPDQIGMIVRASPDVPLVVTVQEISYPGWTVEIDNQGASVESVGGLLGVVLPVGQSQHFIHFAYRPPLLYLGGVITLIAAVLGILYLLQADRFIPQSWRLRFRAAVGQTGRTIYKVLTSPELFEPRMIEPPLLPPGPQRLPNEDQSEEEDQSNKSDVE